MSLLLFFCINTVNLSLWSCRCLLMRLSSMRLSATVLFFLPFRIKVKRRIRIRIRIKVMRICNTAQNKAVDAHNGGLEGRRFLSFWWWAGSGSGTAIKLKAGSISSLQLTAGSGAESALKQCGSAALILRFLGKKNCTIFRKWSQLQEWVIPRVND